MGRGKVVRKQKFEKARGTEVDIRFPLYRRRFFYR
jgi:hypothetical protein